MATIAEAFWYDAATHAIRDENRLTVAQVIEKEPARTGRLMAAGPELFESLRNMADATEIILRNSPRMRQRDRGLFEREVRIARAALANAEKPE